MTDLLTGVTRPGLRPARPALSGVDEESRGPKVRWSWEPAGTGTGIAIAATDTPLPVAALTPGERAVHDRLATERRQRSWRTGRRALRAALGAAGLDADTSRITFPNPRLSLSHSGATAVAAVAVDVTAAGIDGVGIDIEVDRTPDSRTCRLFLTAAEQEWLAGVAPGHRSAQQLRLWTVKEALFKADPGNAHTVLARYRLADPGAGCGWATAPGGRRLWYRSRLLADGARSLAVAPAGPR